jgi:hypothetical protein
MSKSQVEQIEAALGIALATGSNPTAYVVEHVEGGFRIYDDWTDQTFDGFADAISFALQCAAHAEETVKEQQA